MDLFDELEKTKSFEFTPEVVSEKEDELEKTMEIEILDLDFGRAKDEIDNVYSNKKKKKSKKKFLPITVYEEYVLQRTFVNCSILGFITLFFSYGEFIYILTHI